MSFREINAEFQMNQFKKNIDKIYKNGFSVLRVRSEFSKFKRAVSETKDLLDDAKQYIIDKDTEVFGSSNVEFMKVFDY